ncbi:MAG: flagellar motor protein MotB [Alphaproteobacteria bacterium]
MANNEPVIIIRRKKKGGGEGHHGGAWKVAYADFVTAMMAFFLLLWLLNVTTDEQRHGIADYFTPASIARSESGAGGMMGGQTITAPGAMISDKTPPSFNQTTVPSVGQGEEGEEETAGKSEPNAAGQGAKANGGKESGAPGMTGKEQGMMSAVEAQQQAQENASFKDAAEQLRQAILANTALRDLAGQILIDQTPEGLRIQIVDKDNYSMFPSGSSLMYEKSRMLMTLVGKVIARLPNEISVAGHTDSTPFPAGSGRDNWTLSSERANVSRATLVQAGVTPERMARVIGMADRDPLDQDIKAPKNRRISITLLRRNVSEAAAAAPEPMPLDVAPQAVPAPVPTPVAPRREVLPSVGPDEE